MRNMRSAIALTATLAAGCAGTAGYVVSDPVMAGKRYVDAPMSLGAVKMMLKLHEGVLGSADGAGPQNFELSLGFRANHDTARVIVSGATVSYGDGRTGELVTRHESLGTDQGCGFDRAASLPEDYWFNATVTDKLWNCVTLAIVTPGRMAADTLQLKMEPINVNGELVRVLPVTFVPREPQ